MENSNQTSGKESRINFAILAPGGIARTMAKTITKMDEICCYAVGSRSLEKAEQFANEWGFEKAYGSYEEMLNDPRIDLVYVCSPHSLHYQYALMCLNHGKNVLIEKAFTVNAKQAEELIKLSHEKNLLLAEAIWTRYMPSRKMLEDVIDSKIVGEVTSLTANLGYSLSHVERLQKSELAGGALLDLGVYPINFALMAMREKVTKITSDALMSPEGIDWMNSITLHFENNKMAVLHSNMLSQTNRMGVLLCENGYIEVQNINNCEEIRVYDKDYQLICSYPAPKQNTGFEYQVASCVRALRQGKIECEEMPHEEILRVMRIMDEVRAQWNMKFTCE